MEAGISHAGDMDELGPVLDPDLAVILNVGAGHVQGLGGKGVARCKAALLKYLAPGAQALVSADYPDLVREARALCPAAVYFSTTGKQMPYRAAYLGLGEDGRGRYRLRLDGESLDVACSLTGPYGAENVIAAAAAAHLLGLSAEEIARGLEGAALPAQRFARLSVPGWTVIDDSFNANPLSCARMLEAAAELARDRALVCVMGEMLELGDEADREHLRAGPRPGRRPRRVLAGRPRGRGARRTGKGAFRRTVPGPWPGPRIFCPPSPGLGTTPAPIGIGKD